MTLQDLGNIGEFVGAIGVILTLAYLAVQIRQNTRSLRTAAYSSIVTQTVDLNARIAQDGEFAKFLQSGLDGELEKEDFARFNSLMIALVGVEQNFFYLYAQSAIEARDIESSMKMILGMLARPGGAAWWERAGRFGFDPRFVAYVSKQQDSTGGHAAS